LLRRGVRMFLMFESPQQAFIAVALLLVPLAVLAGFVILVVAAIKYLTGRRE